MGLISTNTMGLTTKPKNCFNQFSAHMKITQGLCISRQTKCITTQVDHTSHKQQGEAQNLSNWFKLKGLLIRDFFCQCFTSMEKSYIEVVSSKQKVSKSVLHKMNS